MTLRLLPWAPEYGTAMQFDADAEADGPDDRVDVSIERSDWVAVQPAGRPPRSLQIVDGVRRAEAHAMDDGPDGEPLVGLFGSFAVGVVRLHGADGGGKAHVPDELIHVERRYLQAGGEPVNRAVVSGGHGFAFRARREPVTSANGLVDALNREMLDEEAKLAEELSRDESILTLVDGPLRDLRSPGRRVVGYVKRIVRWYVSAEQQRLIPTLATGWRTPLFRITDTRGIERYSWFMRIASLGSHYHPLGGVMRLEAPGALAAAEAVALADQTALALPRLASSPARDPRAPQNLTPVGALEDVLTHRLGDRLWVRRLIVAATATTAGVALAGAQP